MLAVLVNAGNLLVEEVKKGLPPIDTAHAAARKVVNVPDMVTNSTHSPFHQ